MTRALTEFPSVSAVDAEDPDSPWGPVPTGKFMIRPVPASGPEFEVFAELADLFISIELGAPPVVPAADPAISIEEAIRDTDAVPVGITEDVAVISASIPVHIEDPESTSPMAADDLFLLGTQTQISAYVDEPTKRAAKAVIDILIEECRHV